MKKIGMTMIVGLLLVGAGAAWAQDIVDETMEACKTEIETYCSQVTLGEGRLLACFYAHEDKLSGTCSWALYEGAAKLEQFAAALTHVANACWDDIETYCGDVEMGEGRVASCLLEHQGDVTEACSQAIDDTGMEVYEE
jgi:hypothetical protein